MEINKKQTNKHILTNQDKTQNKEAYVIWKVNKLMNDNNNKNKY
jgi:hypothetical protein